MNLDIAGNPPSIHRIDGRVKTCILLAAIFVSVLLRHWYLVAGQLFVTIILYAGMPFSWNILFRRMVLPFGIAWLVFLDLLFTQGHKVIGVITILNLSFPLYQEGLDTGFLIFLRILTAVSTATILSLSTPMAEILATLRMLKIPGIIIDLAEMIYRYVFLLKETAEATRRAQLSRGVGDRSWFRQIQDTGVIAGNVLIKALERSIRIYKAMLSRGYDETAAAPDYFSQKVDLADFLIGFGLGIALLSLLLFDYIE
ncbi:cobalt ecf transporter t component cbiq [Lucifera butyrica]|uniref:Cobalt ecf transporter t component cbiq n=1 Tax=Lucifera butyrica TaxID=1351585 RepID=A0A498RI33_9FIRM|nr:cobalt ECF transporter T component CbiQ [Lucifera butyrica]VBB09773.1 cobalt ecf transporter t component cbiq [Lucifera butyrica]